MSYLDHNATSPLRPEARAAMEDAFAAGGNPSSIHQAGRAARRIVEGARAQVAGLVRRRPHEIVFTGGGTEANALALWGAFRGAAESGERFTRLFVSAIEHDSVLANASAIAEREAGVRFELLPVTPDGVVDPDTLRARLREGKGRALVAVMAANNETGVLQPVDEIGAICRTAGAALLVDAVQAAGKVEMDCAGADYLSLSAHKLAGPQGVGALVVGADAAFAPMIRGGGQERGLRGGTENLSGIAGFGAAAAACADRSETARIRALRDGFEDRLRTLASDAVIFGQAAPRLANTSNFALPGVSAENALMALDLDGVMVSSGAACSSGNVAPSHVLKAMGVGEHPARCALRVSFGWNSSQADMDAAVSSLSKLIARVRAREAA